MNLIRNFIGNKIVKNAGWLMTGRIINMILSFVIGLITARFLGPGNYGLIGYAIAYFTFFTSICTLGIHSIIVKNFIDHPEEEGLALGSTIVLRIIAAVLSLITIAGITLIVDRNDHLAIIVVLLYNISLVFQSFDIFHQWFQSKLLSKYYAISTLISYLAMSLYKIYLLATGKSVIWFALSNSVDYLVVAIFLFAFYKKCGGPKLRFSWQKGKQLLKLSYSYILVGVMCSAYSITDKFMLKQLIGESEVGYYTLAFSVSSMGTFILSAIIESVSPSIMQYHNDDKQKYIQTNKRLYAIVFYVSILMSVFVFIISPLFVRIVYGEEYMPAVNPLRVAVWYVAFSYLGVARDVWIVCEKKQKYLKYIYLGSALLNIAVNIALIPFFGSVGAAFASLLTQISTIFIFPLLFKDLRPNVKLIIDAVLLRGVLPKKREKD